MPWLVAASIKAWLHLMDLINTRSESASIVDRVNPRKAKVADLQY